LNEIFSSPSELTDERLHGLPDGRRAQEFTPPVHAFLAGKWRRNIFTLGRIFFFHINLSVDKAHQNGEQHQRQHNKGDGKKSHLELVRRQAPLGTRY
jgi:hypothetical protein